MLASNGNDATAALENEPVRAVVTDVDLKGELTGWDVARRARELHPGIPAVYMTGANADEWTAKGVPGKPAHREALRPRADGHGGNSITERRSYRRGDNGAFLNRTAS